MVSSTSLLVLPYVAFLSILQLENCRCYRQQNKTEAEICRHKKYLSGTCTTFVAELAHCERSNYSFVTCSYVPALHPRKATEEKKSNFPH